MGQRARSHPMPNYTRKPSNRRKPQTRRASPVRKGAPAWVWFCSGLVLGIFLMLIKDIGKPDSAPSKETVAAKAQGEDTRHRPRFDFYDLLPESRVPVGADRPAPPDTPAPLAPTPAPTPAPAQEPSPEPAPQPRPAQPEQPVAASPPDPQPAPTRPEPESPPSRTDTPAEESQRFLLQAGSFRSHADADNLRAQLLLMGMSANIETFNPRQGETWHRVIVGPYRDHQSMDSVRSQLAANGIDTLMLRR